MFGPALLFLGMLVFFYGAIAFYLEGRFLPGSEINGYDVSLMNRTEAETLLRDGLIRDYVLRIFDIHGEESEIRGEEIGLSAEFSLEELPLEKREDWLLRLLSPEKQELSSRISYSEEALQTLLTERLLTGKNPEQSRSQRRSLVPSPGFFRAQGISSQQSRMGIRSTESSCSVRQGRRCQRFVRSSFWIRRAAIRGRSSGRMIRLSRRRQRRGTICSPRRSAMTSARGSSY